MGVADLAVREVIKVGLATELSELAAAASKLAAETVHYFDVSRGPGLARAIAHSFKVPSSNDDAIMYRAIKDSVVSVETTKLELGSGVRIARHEQGDIYSTARHNVITKSGVPRRGLGVRLPDGSFRSARVIATDEGMDATLLLSQGTQTDFPLLKLGSSANLRTENRVGLAGFPESVPYSEGSHLPRLSVGNFTEHFRDRMFALDTVVSHFRVQSWPGFSGGAYVHMSDGQVQMVAGATEKSFLPRISFAHPVEALAPMLDSIRDSMPRAGWLRFHSELDPDFVFKETGPVHLKVAKKYLISVPATIKP